jgi:hypothetical protein
MWPPPPPGHTAVIQKMGSGYLAMLVAARHVTTYHLQPLCELCMWPLQM